MTNQTINQAKHHPGHDKHSNPRGSSNSKDSRDNATGSRHWSSSSSTRDDTDQSKDSRSSSRKHGGDASQSTQDMDISPGDSTPTSEVSYSHSATPAQTPTVEQPMMGPVLLGAALPRLISHPHIPTTPTTSLQMESSPSVNPQSTPSMVPPPACVTTSNAPGPPVATTLAQLAGSLDASEPKSLQGIHNSLISRQMGSSDGTGHAQPLTVDTNHTGALVEGPPTPTHSETVDCAKGELFPHFIIKLTVQTLSFTS